MSMRIRVTLRCMAASEIADMIPRETIEEIRKTDPRPLFKAYVAAHEGEATGELVGFGNIVKRWYRAAIEKLHDRIEEGLEVFHSHAATNDRSGSLPIGRVVAKKLKMIEGRLSTIVACYILPGHRRQQLDVASIEADLNLEVDRGGNIIAAGVNEVTGLALANSEVAKPGFDHATLIGELQAFAKKNLKEEDFMPKPTAEEIKAMIREAELQPSDVFGFGELRADPVILEQMREKNASPEIYYEIRDLKRQLAETGKQLTEAMKQNKDLTEKLSTQDGALKTGQLEVAKTKVGTLFEKQKGERKLDEKQEKFIRARLPRFVPQKAEEVEKEFNTYLDGEIDEYAKIAKDVFGIEAENKGTGNEGDKKKDPATGPVDKGKDESPANKYISPATNPMIKTFEQ